MARAKPDFSLRKNVTEKKSDLFSPEERKFIDSELGKYFEEETTFINSLLENNPTFYEN
jgi:Fe-S cluster biosynthesis and repair protein YggX